MEIVIGVVIMVLGAYLLIGLLFSIVFSWKGIIKVDHGMKETGMLMKLLLLPGLIVFWPTFLIKWIKSR